MRLNYLALLVALTALLAAGVARAEELEPGLTMDVELGYDGFIQLGAVNPVTITLENNTADLNLSGELILEHNGIEYVTRLELATPSRKRYFLYFPADSVTRPLMVRIRCRNFSAQREFLTYRNSINAGDANILVVDRQSGSLGILNKQPGVRMQRNLYRDQVPVLTESETYVAYYDIDELDFNPKFFNRADTVVLGDFDYQQVTPDLVNALKACISGGTNVIFSLGNNGQDVAGSLLNQLCPLKVTGTIHTEELGTFGRRYGISAVGTPATLSVGNIAAGAEVLEWANQVPIVVRRKYGCGSVTALAFDYKAQPFKQQTAVAPIFNDAALTVNDSVQVKDWYIHPENIDDVLRGLGEAKPMPPGFVLLFLLAYVVLIGPANFLILGRLKRRTLVWTTIPLLIFGFSYLGLSTGYIYRGSNNVMATFQELHIYPDSEYKPYQTTMLVFTAERTRYELEIPDQYAFLYPDIPMITDLYGMSGGGGRLRGLIGGKIDNSGKPNVQVSQGKWTSKQYAYTGFMPMTATASNSLASSRNQTRTGVDGSFTLDLPFNLYDCFLVTPHGGFPNIGHLEGRGTYDITDLRGNFNGQLPEANYLVAAIDNFRRMLTEVVQPGLDYRNEALLVGFTQEVATKADFNYPCDDHSLTMVVVHLPFEKTIDLMGTTEVSQPLLVGGSKFAPYQEYTQYRAGAAGDRYYLDVDSYVDVAYEISGYLPGESSMTMSLVVQDGQTNSAVTDMTDFLAVEYFDGYSWREQKIIPNMTSVDIDFGSFVNDENRRVVVRFRALREIILGLPDWVQAY